MAWSTEILLSMPLRLVGAESLARYANAWAPVQAYYAVHSALQAAAVSSGMQIETHRRALNFISNFVSTTKWVPDVYCYSCRGLPVLENVQFPRIPPCGLNISNLRRPQGSEEARSLVMTCLKTTRRESAIERRDDVLKSPPKPKAKTKRRNVSQAAWKSAEAGWAPTTLFDFLYRMRIRCNYQETESFIRGSWDDQTCLAFL